MTYGADYADQIRRSPCYVDTMFKGRKRNHLPVEQNQPNWMVINRKSAKAFGIPFRSSILVRATEVIE